MESYYDPKDGGLLIIVSKGGLDDSLAMQTVRDLYERIDKGLTRIIVDCSGMDYISSLDLSVLARVRTRVITQGGDLKLCGVRGMVAQVLNVTRLDKLFDIQPDLESARRAFQG